MLSAPCMSHLHLFPPLFQLSALSTVYDPRRSWMPRVSRYLVPLRASVCANRCGINGFRSACVQYVEPRQSGPVEKYRVGRSSRCWSGVVCAQWFFISAFAINKNLRTRKPKRQITSTNVPKNFEWEIESTSGLVWRARVSIRNLYRLSIHTMALDHICDEAASSTPLFTTPQRTL